MYNEALAREYERMAIFVLPSHIESFGIALAEAMACGCAVVTTRVGFGANLTSDEAILLEEPKSPNLYESVKRLILDPQLRERLGSAARDRVRLLRWGNAVATLSTTYKSWVSQHRQSSVA
jgi:glycosyltransferase involved in cell wall biosynthesis